MPQCSEIVARARVPLNDTDATGYRYSDVDLLQYLRAGVASAYALRPDLRFGSFTTTPAELAGSTEFPLPVHHQQAIADYIVFRAETRDDEHVNANREAKFMKFFQQALAST